jgi:type II secretory pathway pseudopilin PulG
LAHVLQPLENAQRDRRPPTNRGGEAGYALTELLLVSSLLVIVLGAILTLGETSQRIAPKESERALVIREAQVGLHRMTRELRHAYQTPTVTGSTIEAIVPNGSTGRTVRYSCNVPHPTNTAYTRCLRYVVVSGTPGAGELVIDRVLNGTSVFTLHGTKYVRALVEVAAKGDLQNGYDHRVVLDDGFYMRNIP